MHYLDGLSAILWLMSGLKSEAIDGIQPDHEQQLLDDAVLYLQEKRYRDGCMKNEKRCIRRKAKKFMLQDGDLTDLLYTKKTKQRFVNKAQKPPPLISTVWAVLDLKICVTSQIAMYLTIYMASYVSDS